MFLPTSCGGCGAVGASPCPTCVAALTPPPDLAPPSGLDDWVALFAYEGVGRELVARFKYRNARSTLRWAARGLAGLVNADFIDVVTWVPTTESRRRQRGFDHGELLARAVARRIHRPCRPLLRRSPGPAQTGRSAAERRSDPPRFTGRRFRSTGNVPTRILLIDDVTTTGSTLEQAAKAFRGAGAGSVAAAVVARTPTASTLAALTPEPAPSRMRTLANGPRAGLWLQVDASRRRNDPRKATRGC